MKIGVFGTGIVGQAIATKLVELGHEVKLGSRTAKNEKASVWARARGARASIGTFEDAAAFAELVFNCTSGEGSLDALRSAGTANLNGKVLVDLANPLDLSKGMPPTLFILNDDSLGERIQREFPEAKVVKTLNTVNADVMVDPGLVPGEHDVFVSGNDPTAKERVAEILRSFGWKSVVDLGDISTARGTEAYLLFWLRLWSVFGTGHINVKVLSAKI